MMRDSQRETILVVDDVPANIDLLTGTLRDHYRVLVACNGADALLTARRAQPDLILLDVMMPVMDGYEVCRRLKADLRTQGIPIIFVTSLDSCRDEQIGLDLGAVDYIHKPCHPSILLRRVRLHLALVNQNRSLEARVGERTRQLEESRIEIIQRLGRAGEYRDNETGMHVIRMSHSARVLAAAAGLDEGHAELVFLASPMHDIGKIGIPDRILMKPGPLEPEEWEVMKTHTLIGAEILGEHESELLRLARTIALTHHEKWDGSGYPHGLAGDDIPIEGRIVTIADVFDALTSERPYKRAWSVDEAARFLREHAGRQFDPQLVPLFLARLPEVLAIGERFADEEEEEEEEKEAENA